MCGSVGGVGAMCVVVLVVCALVVVVLVVCVSGVRSSVGSVFVC